MAYSETPNSQLKIEKWLETQGYPLEMAVARSYRQADFLTVQSEYYIDPESGQSREIDIFAIKQKLIHKVFINLSFCIECKLARDKPWVVFTSPDIRLRHPAQIVQRVSSRLGTKFLESIVDNKAIQSARIFFQSDRPGYGLTQAFTTAQDVPYTACMSAAKSAAAKAILADQISQTQGPMCSVIFPVVLIDGNLFESYLNDEGQMIISEVQTATLIWRNPVVNMPHTIIKISTLRSLPMLVEEASEAAAFLFACKDEAERLELGDKSPRWSLDLLAKREVSLTAASR